jgi:antitoxin (DNA-binding transcriptional repressor) of toxin-antitoxin stability system
MKASVTDLRYRMKDLLRVIDRGDTIPVFYRGKQIATLMPLDEEIRPKVKVSRKIAKR